MTAPPAKKTYEHVVLERHFAVPRRQAWDALIDLVGTDEELRFTVDRWALTERVLTVEPPWRRVYEIVDGAPVALYQGTTALRDDGDECHLMWHLMIDPLPEGASTGFVVAATAAVERAIDRIAAALERSHR